MTTTREDADNNTIRLACWECNAIYASPRDEPQCPNCGWRPAQQADEAIHPV
jgi:hypothetical protein